ncbi:MAG TPA: sigma-70 family RNA polymerase sigma factor [Euzebyales bacterium]|nr:sigma-70 family RNA polymerase sigma factor [Euzebyales bacterium]
MPSTARDDPSAQFDALVTETRRRVTAFVIRRGTALADVDDVVADVYVVAWRRFDDVDWDDPLPWLIGVARNLLRNEQRTRRRTDALLQRLRSEARPQQVGSDAALGHSDDIRAVRRALADLSDRDRELLQLAAVEELSPTQMAVVLDCHAVTARVRLHRARARLRAALERLPTDNGTDVHAHVTQTEGNQA